MVGYISPAAEALLGYRPEDLLGQPLLVQRRSRASGRAVAEAMAFLAEQPGLVHTIELRLRTRDGRVRLVEAVCQNLVEDPDVGGLVWNGRDVTDRRALEDELTRQALHDPLTGLPNRVLLLDRLAEELRSSRVRGRLGASSSISTASRTSTTRSATPRATSCCGSRRSGCSAACAKRTPPHDWAVTSSR